MNVLELYKFLLTKKNGQKFFESKTAQMLRELFDFETIQMFHAIV